MGAQKVRVDKFKMVAPEGGWGFAVALALSTIFSVTVGPMSAFGILYGSFLSSIGDETSATTIVNGMFNTVLCFTGLPANQLLQKLSYRTVALMGAVLFFAGHFATIFVTSVTQMIITFSILQGMGFGLLLPAMFASFNEYFETRRNMALSIAQVLVMLAQIGCPGVTRMLLDSYGFRGTVAIYAALSLHCVPAALAMQPVKWHLKKKLIDCDETERNCKVKKNVTIVEEDPLLEGSTKTSDLVEQKNVNNGKLSPKVDSFWSSLSRSLDLGLFKDPVYINISLGVALSITSDLAFISILPLILVNNGFDAADVALIMTVHIAADLVCRMLLSVLNAVVSVKNRHLFLVGALFSAIFRIAFVLDNSFWWTAIVSAALGFLRGLIQTPLPLVIAERYTNRFVTAFSLYMVLCGVVAMTVGPLLGYVKSVTNSDVMVQNVLILAYLLCAVPWLVEMGWRRIRKGNRKIIST